MQVRNHSYFGCCFVVKVRHVLDNDSHCSANRCYGYSMLCTVRDVHAVSVDRMANYSIDCHFGVRFVVRAVSSFILLII